MAAELAPRRSQRGLVTGLAVGLAVALCVCGGLVAAIGGAVYPGYRVDRADAIAALRDYLEDIRVEDYPAAYNRLCDEAKAAVSGDEFARRFAPRKLVGFHIGEASLADRGANMGFDVQVQLRFDDGRARTDVYFVFGSTTDLDRYYVCPPAVRVFS